MQPFICLRANSEVQILSRLLRAPASGRLFATTARRRPGLPRTPRLASRREWRRSASQLRARTTQSGYFFRQGAM